MDVTVDEVTGPFVHTNKILFQLKCLITQGLVNFNFLKIGLGEWIKNLLPCSACVIIIVKLLGYNSLAGGELCAPILRFVLLVPIHCPIFLHSSVPNLLFISLCLMPLCSVPFFSTLLFGDREHCGITRTWTSKRNIILSNCDTLREKNYIINHLLIRKLPSFMSTGLILIKSFWSK